MQSILFFKPQFVIEYLGRYTHKIAISNHRITNIDKANKTVSFTVKNYTKGGKKQCLTLSSKDFVKRFSLHILPKGFTRIRYYGILSSSWKKVKLPELQKLLNEQIITATSEKPPLQHRKCPSCKKGTLETVLLFDERGPPLNWKKILAIDNQNFK